MGRPRNRIQAQCPSCGETFERPVSAITRSTTAYCSSFCWYGRNSLEEWYIRRDGDECWLWIGGLDSDGYAQWKGARGHRAVFEKEVGLIPTGLVLDHLCRNRSCVNPAHLEPVTNRENILRGEGLAARNAEATHCANGHEFTEENTYTYTNESYPHGRRVCKTCVFERQSARRRARARLG